MGSIHTPSGDPPPHDPYEKYRVEAIEKETIAKEKRERENEPPPKGKSVLLAYILTAFRKITELFLESPGGKLASSTEKTMREDLLLLRAAFEILKNEDRSQDIPFLNSLSRIWHSVLEDSLRFKREAAVSLQYKSLIKKIQQYPESQEHTLGYYLFEYAGQKWLPFPYMELIQKIHYDCQNHPTNNVLTEWILLIDELTLLLNKEE